MRALTIITLFLLGMPASDAGAEPKLDLKKGDRVVFVGNTFAERLQLWSHFEAMLTIAEADKDLTFRNLGWSADTLTLKPRPEGFGSEDEHLKDKKADVIFACYGMNESFDGEAGLAKYEKDWREFIAKVKKTDYSGKGPPRLVMVGPIHHEDLGRPLPEPTEHNRSLKLYSDAMGRIAAEEKVVFIDLFTPTQQDTKMNVETRKPLTINGIHLSERGDFFVARMMMQALGHEQPVRRLSSKQEVEANTALHAAILRKNEYFFHRWRAVNGEYIYGRRKAPFGVVSFPPEMKKLDEMIAAEEAKVHEAAKMLAKNRGVPSAP